MLLDATTSSLSSGTVEVKEYQPLDTIEVIRNFSWVLAFLLLITKVQEIERGVESKYKNKRVKVNETENVLPASVSNTL